MDRIRLTFDSFPRCANRFTQTCLELAFPQYKVRWLFHRGTFFDKSNVLTVIRNPKQCVASCLESEPNDDPERLLDWYCRFMVGTIDNSHRIFVTDFDLITVKPESVMRAYANQFDLPEPQPVTLAIIEAKVKETHAAHLPKPLTAERIRANQRVLDSPSLLAALDLYKQAQNNSYKFLI
jgi:hypothetical protein